MTLQRHARAQEFWLPVDLPLSAQFEMAMTVYAPAPLLLFTLLWISTVADAAIIVVQQYDGVQQTNSVDVSGTSLSVGQFSNDVALAFDAGTGGVINFEAGQGSVPNSRMIDAIFDGGNKTLRITNSPRDWSVGFLGFGPTDGPISGGRVLFNGAPNQFPTPFENRIVFGDVVDNSGTVIPEAVQAFGLTVLDSNFNNSGNTVEFTVSYSDGQTQFVSQTIPRAINTADTFFGFEAPAGQFISEIGFTATNNLATDDWAFITTTVSPPSVIPEPGSGSALGLIVLHWLFRHRKKRKVVGARTHFEAPFLPASC
ncbi:MAG: hypothetical protein AAF670_16650 [Planctomycetota bacterium]